MSLDDGEVLGLTQAGIRNAPGERSVLAMGGDSTSDADHVVTEAAIRAFYGYYRNAMANLAVYESLSRAATTLLCTRRYDDVVVVDDGQLRFRQKHCIYDGDLVIDSIVYPL